MHHRRMFFDDWRGVGECLNETDESGNGIRVTSKYYLQIFNSGKEPSLQRSQQLFVDDPQQYFYNFNYQVSSTPKGDERKRLLNQDELRILGLPATGKLTIFAQAQDQLLLRLTNYADKFDLGPNPDTPYVKVDQLALALYQSANPQAAAPQVIISETSLTGNQLYSQM